jgi:dTDP-4-amino-4,6-dideoxygalactose transaminase
MVATSKDPRMIPINALGRHIAPLQAELAAIAAEVVASGHYVLGPGVRAFEQAFAGWCGVAEAVGVANGTDALELALKAVGVGPGDRVALAPNAAMYGSSATLACAAEPLFVDVDAEGLMTLDTLRAAVEREGLPKAVIVTHLYGRLAAIEPIVAWAAAQGVAVVEDCAQAHGARRGGRRAGAFGDAAAFSFYPTKNLGALGDGGAVLTACPERAARLRQLRQYGWSAKYTNALPGGRNSRLDELQARFLLAMLPRLDGWNARRRAIARRYVEGIRHPQLRLPALDDGEAHVAHLFVLRSARREALAAHLHAAGVQTDIHYPLPDHRQPCFGGRYDALLLPGAEREAREVLSLPCFPELADAEVEAVIAACNAFPEA